MSKKPMLTLKLLPRKLSKVMLKRKRVKKAKVKVKRNHQLKPKKRSHNNWK